MNNAYHDQAYNYENVCKVSIYYIEQVLNQMLISKQCFIPGLDTHSLAQQSLNPTTKQYSSVSQHKCGKADMLSAVQGSYCNEHSWQLPV